MYLYLLSVCEPCLFSGTSDGAQADRSVYAGMLHGGMPAVHFVFSLDYVPVLGHLRYVFCGPGNVGTDLPGQEVSEVDCGGICSHNRLSCKADLYFCAVCGLAGVRNPVTAFPAGKVEGAGGSGVQYGGVLVHGSVHSPVDSAHLQFPADAGVRDALHPFPDDGFQ